MSMKRVVFLCMSLMLVVGVAQENIVNVLESFGIAGHDYLKMSSSGKQADNLTEISGTSANLQQDIQTQLTILAN